MPEKDLPVELPYVEEFRPTGTDKSPLATVEEFVKTKFGFNINVLLEESVLLKEKKSQMKKNQKYLLSLPQAAENVLHYFESKGIEFDADQFELELRHQMLAPKEKYLFPPLFLEDSFRGFQQA